MKAITTKPTQMRLDTYVFARPKWTKIHENPRQYARPALKIDDFLTDTAVRVENVLENA